MTDTTSAMGVPVRLQILLAMLIMMVVGNFRGSQHCAAFMNTVVPVVSEAPVDPLRMTPVAGTTTHTSSSMTSTRSEPQLATEQQRTLERIIQEKQTRIDALQEQLRSLEQYTKVPPTNNNTQPLTPTDKNKKKKDGPPTKIFFNFFSHIPKSGASYGARAMNDLIFNTPEWKDLPPHERYRMCSQGTQKAKFFHSHYRSSFRHVKCTMWMSETLWTPEAHNVYTLIRNPKTHVISQYFHCLESKEHQRYAHRMPSTLEAWLQLWVDAMDEEQERRIIDPNGTKAVVNTSTTTTTTKAELNAHLQCYDPRNLQSRFTRFDPQHHDQKALASRFRVLGLTDQMDKSVCVMAMEYGGMVPDPCNCTGMAAAGDESPGLTNLAAASPARRRLVLEYDAAKHAHGVTHHGNTYQTTANEDALIARLTQTDSLLYQYTRNIFEEHVQRLEAQHGITICNQYRKV